MKTALRVIENTEAPRGPAPVDLHVGGRVRMRRKQLEVSQEALAEAIGLTFQQVQKHERGMNRISASKLYDIACALKVPVQFFFEGYTIIHADEVGEGVGPNEINAFLMTTEGIDLARAVIALPPKARRKIVAMAEMLAELYE